MLATDTHAFSIAKSNTQNLYLDAGVPNRSRFYWILGSATGTSPGVSLGGVTIPLVPDPWTDVTIGLANSMYSPNISRASFQSDGFVLATDLESVPGQAHGSGYSTHNSQMTIDLRGLGATSADLPVQAFVTVFHEALITIEQDGVTLAI